MEEIKEETKKTPSKTKAKNFILKVENVSHVGGLSWTFEYKGDKDGLINAIDEAIKSAPNHISMVDVASLKEAVANGEEWSCRVGKCVYGYTLKK